MLPRENRARHQGPWWQWAAITCHCDVTMSGFLPGGSQLLSSLSPQQPLTVSIFSVLGPVIKFQGCCHGSFFFPIEGFKLRGHLSRLSNYLAFETHSTSHGGTLLRVSSRGTAHIIILICHNKSLVASNTTSLTRELFAPAVPNTLPRFTSLLDDGVHS